MTDRSLPDELRDFAERAAGPVETVAFVSVGETGARIWSLHHASGQRTHLKAPAQEGKARREIDAYRDWLDGLPDVPTLLAERMEPTPALLLTTLPGESAADESLAHDEAAHRHAGRFAARLHNVAFHDRDAVSIEQALALRLASWRARAERVLTAEALQNYCRTIETGPPLDGPRVPCHRDFQPRNWLVQTPQVAFGVIDFEHARPDHWLADVVRLANGPWRSRPALRDAFFDGYGRHLDDCVRGQIARLSALDALATATWMAERSPRAR